MINLYKANDTINRNQYILLTLKSDSSTHCVSTNRISSKNLTPLILPHLVKEMLCLESVERRATRYILNDYSRHTSYKSRLINTKLLPLMYWLELQDVLFLVKCLQGTMNNFNIHDFIPAPSSSHRPTRASQSGKFNTNFVAL